MRVNPFIGKVPRAMWGTSCTAKKRAKKVHWLKEQQTLNAKWSFQPKEQDGPPPTPSP